MTKAPFILLIEEEILEYLKRLVNHFGPEWWPIGFLFRRVCSAATQASLIVHVLIEKGHDVGKHFETLL